MHVLIIEDDRRLAHLLAEELEAERIVADVVYDGESGLDLLLRGIYDVAIIDWMIPERDGPSICRAVRNHNITTALLLLTARTQVEDRVFGLENGADDYLIKPFAFVELLARIRVLSRRYMPGNNRSDELRQGDLVLNVRTHLAYRGDQLLELTMTEWRLLEFLMRHPGQALTRDQILDYVWSYERDVQINLVDVYISYLRRKLDQPGKPDPIKTVRGVGYRLKAAS
ncbi:MAG: response regulator transcription factor [Chloroflexaceae bacterium]|nr:response regulator transcription factor [Chloroflexaceae bacterium]